MSEDLRISDHPHLKFDRGKKVQVTFDGRQFDAYENESVGAALYASGVRIFNRSFKYHRPRGLYCMSGRCPNCMMRVNGVPSVRVCAEQARDGTTVTSQNSYPNVTHDVYGLMDHLDFMFPIGFQYRKFIRPRFMWPLYERIIRKMAGVGDLPDENAFVPCTYPELSIDRNIEVAVVGGGPAGLAAAISAAKTGSNVVLFDENRYLGGHLAKETRKYKDAGAYSELRGFEIAQRMQKEARSLKSLTTYPETTATGYYEGGILTVTRQMGFQELTPKTTILAPGAYERTMLFDNNDLPGIFSANGLQTLMHIHGIRPGRRAVVVSNNGDGAMLGIQLLEAQVDVEVVLESSSKISQTDNSLEMKGHKIPNLYPYTVKSAHGKERVEGITAVQVDEAGQPVTGTEKSFSCDTVCVSGGTNPAFDLLFLAGCEMKYNLELDAFLPTRNKNLEGVPGIFAVGDVCRAQNLKETILEGSIAGLSAALHVRHGDNETQMTRDSMIAELTK